MHANKVPKQNENTATPSGQQRRSFPLWKVGVLLRGVGNGEWHTKEVCELNLGIIQLVART